METSQYSRLIKKDKAKKKQFKERKKILKNNKI